MSRYTGPRVKKMRALGVDLPGLSRKSIQRRPYRPGSQGQKPRRRLSDFGTQLNEKQKLRLNYGITERQLRRIVTEATKSKGNTAKRIAEFLERRLDNVVFRAGFAPTIPAARQLVSHGHFAVNGRKTDVASFRVKQGDVITPREKSKNLEAINSVLVNDWSFRPDWLEVDVEEKKITVSAIPEAETIPFPVELQLVVEYYSKKL